MLALSNGGEFEHEGEENEQYEPEDPDDVENPDGSSRNVNNPDHNAFEDPDSRRKSFPAIQMGDDGTPASVAKYNNVIALKEKRIPDDKRIMTPFMTKYEKTRLCGVRATQIRLVGLLDPAMGHVFLFKATI